MLTIRLQRVGKKNDPSFRVVVADSKRSAKSSNIVENVGSYDARQGKPILNAERINYWRSVGAQVSDTVHNLLVKYKVIEAKKINVAPVPKPKPVEEKKEVKAEEKKEIAEEAKVEEAPVSEETPAPEVEVPAEEPKVEEAPVEVTEESKTAETPE